MKKLVNFVFELFHLKQIKHEGPRLAGVQFPDSVAEHTCNAAQIWYLLAKMEWADANKVVTILVFHDMAETRLGDIHKVWSRYITNKKVLEKDIMKDQLGEFDFAQELREYFHEYEERVTLEWKIAKDADYLEQAFQAKIYVEQWYADMQDRIDNVWKALRTESALQVWQEMITSRSTDWRKKTWLKDLSDV